MVESSRLTQMEKEIERLNKKLEYSEDNHKRDIQNIYEIISEEKNNPKTMKPENDEFIKRNEFNEMKGRINRMETTLFNQEHDREYSTVHRSRRGISSPTPPPCNFKTSCAFDFKDKLHEENISKPPRSCMDLRKTGHVLNGYYPIKRTQKITLVFCNFDLDDNNVSLSSSKGGKIKIIFIY